MIRATRDPDWKKWERKLLNFQRWRDHRYKKRAQGDPETLAHERRQGERVNAFYAWCGSLRGNLLDVGCGGGWPKGVFQEARYFGIDPIIMDDREDFYLIKAVGEQLPFKSSVFEGVLINASLDHLASIPITFEECFRILKTGGSIYIFTSIKSGYPAKGPSPQNLFQPIFVRLKEKFGDEGFLALLKSLYYRIYYSKILSEIRNNTHVQEIVLSELVEILLTQPARLTIERVERDYAFVRALKTRRV